MNSTRELEALKALGNHTDGFFLSVIQASVDCIKIIELDGSVLFVNDNGLCILEARDAAQMVGMDWAELWPEESREVVQRSIQSARNGSHTRFEACCPTFTGGIRWWDVSVSPVRDKSGVVRRILAISRDVTSILERERQAHERELQIRSLVERQQEELAELRQEAPQPSVEEPRAVDRSALEKPSEIDEEKRLEALLETGLLDSIEEERFDHLTRLAADALNVPTALVSLVDRDRQWFKSRHNFSAKETPRNVSFCAMAIQRPEDVMIVEDARNDPRVCENPLVTGGPKIAFYAGVPLVTDNGFPIGTLCVIDYKPRTLSERERNVLESIAATVMTEIALVAKERERSDLDVINMELRHRMGNTYARVSSLVSMIGRSETEKDAFIAKLQSNIGALARLQSDIALNAWESVPAHDLVARALDIDVAEDGASIYQLDVAQDLEVSSQGAFMMTLVIQELASNAAKHGALMAENGRIIISARRGGDRFEFRWSETFSTTAGEVKDTGSGFGSKLLTQIVPMSLGGEAEYSVNPDTGCEYTLVVDATAILT